MRLAVVGSRSFDDYQLLIKTLQRYHVDTIVSGGARGADSLAKRYAHEFKLNLVEFIPEWYDAHGQYNPSAGFVRNRKIVDSADVVVAFWDGVSSGTRHSIKYAKSRGLNCDVIAFNNPKEEESDQWII